MSGTFREIHYGIITDNADDERRGRVKVKCRTLLPDDTEWPDWIEPVFPYLSSSDQQKATGGWLFIPDIGIVVELEVVASAQRDEQRGAASFQIPDIRWRACVWSRGGDEMPEEFTTNYPNRRGFKTGRGHLLIFDDTDGAELVRLAHSSGSYFDMLAGKAVELMALSVVIGDKNTATSVIIDTPAGFQSLLGGALSELSGLLAGLGLPAPNTVALAALLQSGSFSSLTTRST